MRFIRTRTESLNASKISRIAYLSPTERRRLSDKLHRPDWHRRDEGEVIADMGRAEPVILGYVADAEVGSRIVALLTDFITSGGTSPGVLDYDWVEERAALDVDAARYRAEVARETAEHDGDDDDDGMDRPVPPLR